MLSLKYVPTILRVDAGTENTLMGDIHQALRHYHTDADAGQNSYIVGPSTANQRVERFWGEAKALVCGFFMNLFKTLMDQNLLNKKDVVDIECLRYCFGRLIQRRLLQAKDEWNSHRIRAQPHKNSPTGIPNILYHWPQRYNAKYCQKNVDEDIVKKIKQKYCNIEPKFYNIYTQKLVETVLPNARQPETIEKAIQQYVTLKTHLGEAQRIQFANSSNI